MTPPGGWLLGTTDGIHFVLSRDTGDMPAGGTIAEIRHEPTEHEVEVLENQGCEVRWIADGDCDYGE